MLGVRNPTSMNIQKHRYQVWSAEDRARFWQLYQRFKREFEKYVPCFPGRTKLQIQSFYYNQKKLRKPGNGKATPDPVAQAHEQ